MTDQRKGWSWFERENERPDETDLSPVLPNPERELRLSYARCFSTPEGQKVVAHLRAITMERAFGPDVSTELLRHIEGQRQLVSYIVSLTDQGRTGG